MKKNLKININLIQYEELVKFIESIDDELILSHDNTELYYNDQEECINIPFGEYEIFDNTEPFLKFLKECFPYDISTINLKVLAILHEIGHYITLDEELIDKRLKRLAFLEFEGAFGIRTTEELQYEYYKIPGEFEATQWGIWYYLTHEAQCKKLANLFELGIDN